jgi:hypothetical protein
MVKAVSVYYWIIAAWGLFTYLFDLRVRAMRMIHAINNYFERFTERADDDDHEHEE